MPRLNNISLKGKGEVIEGVCNRIHDGKSDFRLIPGTLIRIIEDDLWRHYVSPTTGEEVTHDSFEAFVVAKFPQGLSTTMKMITNICTDEPKALDAIDRACQRNNGGDRKSDKISVDNIHTDRPSGTSKTAALRKLRADRPDLHARVLAKEISPHAAMVEAGFRRRQTPLQAAQKAVSKMSESDLASFDRWYMARRQTAKRQHNSTDGARFGSVYEGTDRLRQLLGRFARRWPESKLSILGEQLYGWSMDVDRLIEDAIDDEEMTELRRKIREDNRKRREAAGAI